MKTLYLFGLITAMLLVAGCGHTHLVTVPPAIELKNHEPLGIIIFSSNAQGKLNKVVTQRVLEAMTEDQKLIRIIELGKQAEVLKEIGLNKWGLEAVKAIGDKYDVKAIITGDIDVSKVKPHVSIGPGVLGVSADVEAKLTIRLQETETGATLWSNSASDARQVGEVSLFGGDWLNFDAQDPDRAYGDLADELAYRTTGDFRATYRRVRD